MLPGAFPPDLTHATTGQIAPLGRQAIDPVSPDARLAVVRCDGLGGVDAAGRRRSDHLGLHLVLRRAG